MSIPGSIRRLRYRLGQLVLPKQRARDVYYPQLPDCQIPELSAILELFLSRRNYGSFVEVGANDGRYVSNTWGLASRGWRGLLIEPVPSLARVCRLNHEEHPRVSVLEYAVGAPGVETVTLHLAGALTSANEDLIEEYSTVGWAKNELQNQTLVVQCETLDIILANEAFDPGFDLLVVDVEGFEREVFSGFSLELWRPKMMIVELSDTHPDLHSTARGDAELSDNIQSNGYTIVFKDQVNTIFVRRDVRLDVYRRKGLVT